MRGAFWGADGAARSVSPIDYTKRACVAQPAGTGAGTLGYGRGSAVLYGSCSAGLLSHPGVLESRQPDAHRCLVDVGRFCPHESAIEFRTRSEAGIATSSWLTSTDFFRCPLSLC